MRKHEEGYTLVMVLIVMLIMCSVAISVLSVSAANLQKQKDSLARMQDKYDAQGKLEQICIKVEEQLKFNGFSNERLNSAVANIGEGVAVSEELAYRNEPGQSEDYLCFSLTVQSGTVQINCEFRITGNITASVSEPGLYNVDDHKMGYSLYEILAVNEEEGGATE